ncbi:hypothetical protein SAMN02745120_0592 [Acetoanaerobium noterae]|uniref:Uncharacterized protein n=1 Tax=Acetoanaerobium noterae TaxID=745369 RepID=A0A1T4ZZW9_9FIRM|nr:hypothetical protein [Acetoanaerobium noterae]SKB28282.1 hypothetical protein SAMN02745120_0592 [Acetoanaerobium noterae]
MALVQNKYSFSYAPLAGDLAYSKQNRILLEIVNFLINNGCTMVYSYYPAATDTSSNRYTFHVRGNIYINIYFSGPSTLSLNSGFGPLNSSGNINGYMNNARSISPLPSSGVLAMNYVSSNNYKIFLLNDYYVFSCCLFNKGWVNCEYHNNRFVLELDGLYFFCSKVTVENSFSMTDINDKHLLLNPIFTFNKVPKNANDFKIDDDIIYVGECYVYPASMGTLQENIFYQASDGTKYFNGGLLSKILIVD